jgi:hypothetical protein
VRQLVDAKLTDPETKAQLEAHLKRQVRLLYVTRRGMAAETVLLGSSGFGALLIGSPVAGGRATPWTASGRPWPSWAWMHHGARLSLAASNRLTWLS